MEDKFSSQYGGAIRDGLETLDLNQSVTFQAYSRVVLPIDGYVFWQPTVTVDVKGSLHFAQEIQQNDDESLGAATVQFTAEKQIVLFSDIPPNTIYVAWAGKFRYAFSAQQGYYKQVGIWHYFGHSISPAMSTQLLDKPGMLDPKRAVTSNSMALWLALNRYVNPFYDGFSNPTLLLYPAFLTPANLEPPYAAVDIEHTRSLQPTPYLTRDRSHYQLAADRVRIILYGLQSDEAIDFLDCVFQYSLNTENFGIMNMPIIADHKRVQTELQAIAMKKVIEFEVSYYQTRVAAVSRQLILSAPITFLLPPTGGFVTDSSGDVVLNSSGDPVTSS